MERSDKTTTDSRSSELVRPVQGRMLGGVAKGVAENFGISEWIPRILFIVTAFMGGLGVALYAAGWAFIRSEDEQESPADRFFSGASTSRSWVGIGLIIIAGIIVLSNLTFLSGEVVWAVAFLVVGLLLYLGYIPSRAANEADASSDSTEGAQRMTPTEAVEPKIDQAPADESPVGGTTPPPPVPTPTPPALPPSEPRERSILGRLTIGAMLVAMGVLAIVDNIPGVPIDAHPRHYMALAVTILGIGLLVGSVLGRARWLILVGIIMVPTLLFSPVFEYEWDSADFDHQVSPVAFDDVESSYVIDIGTLVIDLRELPWDGQEVTIDASVDAGNLEIFIPHDVGIIGTAAVDVGRVSEPGRTSAGLGDPRLDWDTPGESGTVVLDARVNIGNIEIRR